MITLATARRGLAAHRPRLLEEDAHGRAAVALVLRGADAELEILLIRRAARADDPWSGQIAFPGGRVEKHEDHPRRAAERETEEETGVDLAAAEFLGRLDDMRGRPVPFVISAFVYHLSADRPLVPSAEVARAFWVRLEEMLDPRNRTTYRLSREGEDAVRPAITLRGEGDPPLWGLTYRLLESFLEAAGLGRPG